MEQKKKNVPFSTIVSALLDENNIFPPSYLHRFSDISRQDLETLKKAWPQVNARRRAALFEDLEELAEADTLVSFDDLSLFALTDPDPRVRAAAIRLLWEAQDLKLVPIFITLFEQDEDIQVRAAAASGLGVFVYLGELEEIPAETLRDLENRLLAAASGSGPTLVRQRAIEALGFSSRDEVPPLIQTAFDSGDTEWLTTALFAMGRSADPRWEASVLSMLQHPDERVQAEAVRAAGNLELAAARMPLIDLISEEELQEDVMAAAIWSLSQIGGDSVRGLLENLLDNTEDEDEAAFIEQAIENLSFTEDFEVFDLLDFGAESDDDPGEQNGKPARPTA